MKKKELEEAINSSLLSPYRENMVNLIKPSINLCLKFKKEIEIGKSKFGGSPDLPINLKWPLSKDGIPYNFLCQINLSDDLIKYKFNHLIKEGGILYFFVDSQSAYSGKVIFLENKNILERREMPVVKPKRSLFKQLFSIGYKKPIKFQPYEIRYDIKYTIPAYDSLIVEKKNREKGLKLKLENIIANESFFDIFTSKNCANKTKHQLFGYYQGNQNGFLEVQLKYKTYKEPDQLSDEELEELIKWRTLLQIDSDDMIGFNWGDSGSIIFLIKESDLLQKDFSSVKMILDTT